MDIRLDQTTLETCPFGELRHGAAAYEAVVARGRADGGGEIPVAATCVHVDEALSQRLGQAARSLAFAWVNPEGVIPATHIWPLRPTQAFQQWARRALRRNQLQRATRHQRDGLDGVGLTGLFSHSRGARAASSRRSSSPRTRSCP